LRTCGIVGGAERKERILITSDTKKEFRLDSAVSFLQSIYFGILFI